MKTPAQAVTSSHLGSQEDNQRGNSHVNQELIEPVQDIGLVFRSRFQEQPVKAHDRPNKAAKGRPVLGKTRILRGIGLIRR